MNYRKSLLALAVGAALAMSAVSATAATYQFRQAAKGLESPLVTPSLGSFGSLDVRFGEPALQLTAPSSTSPAAFTFVSSNPEVAAVSGDTVTLLGAGQTTITALQAAAPGFEAASVTATLTVAPGLTALTGFGALSAQMGAAPFALTPPSSNRSGTITYVSSNPAVATISGGMVTLVGVGTATITATQAATPNYEQGTATAVLTVAPAPLPAGYFTHNGVTWTTRSTAYYTQPAGHAYCAGGFAGTTGWRLPTVAEMDSAKNARKLTGGNINSWNYEYLKYSQTEIGSGGGWTMYDSSHPLHVYCVKPA